MPVSEEKRYSISEASRLTGVATYVLRQWEERFDALKPKRDRRGRRYYTAKDIEVIYQIRKLLWQDKLKSDGVNKLLKQGRKYVEQLEVRKEVVDLVDEIEQDIRELLDLLDKA